MESEALGFSMVAFGAWKAALVGACSMAAVRLRTHRWAQIIWFIMAAGHLTVLGSLGAALYAGNPDLLPWLAVLALVAQVPVILFWSKIEAILNRLMERLTKRFKLKRAA